MELNSVFFVEYFHFTSTKSLKDIELVFGGLNNLLIALRINSLNATVCYSELFFLLKYFQYISSKSSKDKDVNAVQSATKNM